MCICCYLFIADVLNVNSGCEKVTPSYRIITEAEKPLCESDKPRCGADKSVTSKEMSLSQTLAKFLSSEDMNKIISCMYK